MLQLASAAFPEVAARRRGMVGGKLKRAVSVEQVSGRCAGNMDAVRRHSVALGGDADDGLTIASPVTRPP